MAMLLTDVPAAVLAANEFAENSDRNTPANMAPASLTVVTSFIAISSLRGALVTYTWLGGHPNRKMPPWLASLDMASAPCRQPMFVLHNNPSWLAVMRERSPRLRSARCPS